MIGSSSEEEDDSTIMSSSSSDDDSTNMFLYQSRFKMSKKESKKEREKREKREKREAHRAYLRREIQRYKPGEKLTLYPREPSGPYGLRDDMGLPPDGQLPSGQIRNFDPTTEVASEELAQVQVLNVVSGGTTGGAQVLLCVVLKAPTHTQPEDTRGSYKPFDAGLKVVLKVYDSIFFPDPYDDDNKVDGKVNCEANALQRLYGKGLTGHPHLNPQYYGSWAMKFNVGDSSEVQWLCRGAVLIEYIEGASMESLCDRDEYGQLDPETAFLIFPSSRDGKSGMSFRDISARLKVFRALLDGCVSWFHAGVDHEKHFVPEDVFITLGNNGVDLEEPRVVLLNYSTFIVWSDTQQSKIGRADEVSHQYPAVPSKYLLNVYPFERLPRPPHPAWKFNIYNVSHFAGWFQSEWRDCPADFKNWLKEEFGELVEGRYSTYETLEAVMNLAVAKAKGLYAKDLGIDLSDVSNATTGEPGDLDLGGVFVKPDPGLLQFPEREQERLESEAYERKVMEEHLERHRKLREWSEAKHGNKEIATEAKDTEKRTAPEAKDTEKKPALEAKDGDRKFATLTRGTLSKVTAFFKRGENMEGGRDDDGGHESDGGDGRSATAAVGEGSVRASMKR